MLYIYNVVSAENARIFYQGFVDRVKSMYKSDKVFDTAVYPEYIERLMVTKKIFDNISDSLKYIQRSIFV